MFPRYETGGTKMHHINNNKRSIQSSEWIYAALRDLMNEKKYEDIKITEIVERAKVGRSTFYRNFDNIDDILHYKCNEKLKELKEYIQEFQMKLDENTENLFLRPFLRFWYLDSTIIELLIASNRLDILSDIAVETFGTFFPSSKFLNEANAKYADYLLSIRFGVAINLLTQWIKNNKRDTPDDLTDMILSQIKLIAQTLP